MLTSVFWLFFTIFRFLSAVQARYMQPKTMLWTSLIGCTVSTVIMTVTTNSTVIYIAVAIFGGSMSNCFATGFLYAQSFLEVSGKLASIFIFGGAMGWAGMPTVAGFVLEGLDQNLSDNFIIIMLSIPTDAAGGSAGLYFVQHGGDGCDR